MLLKTKFNYVNSILRSLIQNIYGILFKKKKFDLYP